MMQTRNGKLVLAETEYENPLDAPMPKRNFKEWQESQRISFKSIWIDRYIHDGTSVYFESVELKLSNRGRCFLDEKELKGKEDIESVKEIFKNLKFV